jgi:hypothetical protein
MRMVVVYSERDIIFGYMCYWKVMMYYATSSTTERNAYVVVVVSRSGPKWRKLTEKEAVIE